MFGKYLKTKDVLVNHLRKKCYVICLLVGRSPSNNISRLDSSVIKVQCFLLKCWTLGYTWQRGAVCIGEAMQISQIFVSSTSCWVNLIGWTHDLYIFGDEKWIAYEMWRCSCVFFTNKHWNVLNFKGTLSVGFCVLWNESIEAWDQATGPPCFLLGKVVVTPNGETCFVRIEDVAFLRLNFIMSLDCTDCGERSWSSGLRFIETVEFGAIGVSHVWWSLGSFPGEWCCAYPAWCFWACKMLPS